MTPPPLLVTRLLVTRLLVTRLLVTRPLAHRSGSVLAAPCARLKTPGPCSPAPRGSADPMPAGSDVSGSGALLNSGGDLVSRGLPVATAGLRGPWWLILAHAARPSSRRARWLVRRRSSGVPVQ